MGALVKPVVFDIESYPNYFLVSFKKLGDQKYKSFETSDRLTDTERKALRTLCARRTLIGYYSQHYDMIMLSAALAGWTVKNLNVLSNQIIKGNNQHWMTMRENGLYPVRCKSHIDISNSLGTFALGLKSAACRIGYDVVWDLPYKPETVLTDEQKETVAEYCKNDLGITDALYYYPSVFVRVQQRLAASVTRKESFDWINDGDVRIAETMIKNRAGVTKVNKDLLPPNKGNVELSAWLTLPPMWGDSWNETVESMISFIHNYQFELVDNKVKLPKKLDRKVDLNGVEFKFGRGGIHTTQKNTYAKSSQQWMIYDVDVASYYPHLILGLEIEPPRMKGRFMEVYRKMLRERMEAKKSGDTITADVLKLVVNSAYGKFGNPYSAMFDPYALMSVTFSGQLGMLRLCEHLQYWGMTVISSNTDSVTACFPRRLHKTFKQACGVWESDSGMTLEFDLIKGIYFRDVNNYLSISASGHVKGKGFFGKPGPQKGVYPRCIVNAVTDYLKEGIEVERTIYSTWDPADFCHAVNIKAGAEFDGQHLGKNPRWVWQKGSDQYIKRVTNGSKIPLSDGCRPLMNLADSFEPDYNRYVETAYQIINDLTEKRIC